MNLYISESCIDRVFEVIAACYHRAILDARRGSPDAIYFLDVTAPDWRERLTVRKPKFRRQEVRA